MVEEAVCEVPQEQKERVKSTHKAEVVPVVMTKHTNADTLSVVSIFDGGYTCVVRTEDWIGKTKAVYIPPDSTVDVRRPEFAFLAAEAKADNRVRIRAKKLRGVVSFGMLVPVADDAVIGTDMAGELGIEHYEPPIAELKGSNRGSFYMGGELDSGPTIFSVKYDVDTLRRYKDRFVQGEPVYVTIKMDGSNARFVYSEGKFHCGSRTMWKREFPSFSHVTKENLLTQGVPEDRVQVILEDIERKKAHPRKNMWHELLDLTPSLRAFLEANPDYLVYGECVAAQGRIKYGFKENVRFFAFDVMKDGKWIDFGEMVELLNNYDVPIVPVLDENGNRQDIKNIKPIPFDFELICKLSEGLTLCDGVKDGVIREGVVVEPVNIRIDPHIGRIKLKVVSSTYLEKYK